MRQSAQTALSTLDQFSLISEYDMEVRHYITAAGVDRFQNWLDELQDVQTIDVILRRLDRLERGNLGDCRFCAEGVWELRIDFGPGYRIYYAQRSKTLILLLCAGTKRTQTADINNAIAHWRDFQRRHA
jgi:putative addiction module killer protein